MHEGAAPSAYGPGAPSKRATTGDAAHGCANQRQRPGRGAFVHHEKERRQRDSWVRVRPAGSWQCCPRASMRPRWPVVATTLNKTRRRSLFSPRQGVACGEVDGGLMRRLTGSSRGILARGLGAGRDTQARPGAHFTESPLGTRPSRPGSDAREPKQQAPVHLGARVPSASAKRTTSPSAKQRTSNSRH